MLFLFDNFSLDTDRFELRRGEKLIRAEPQVVELLAHLVANNHRLVTRDEIVEKIWLGRVVSEAAISSRIKAARHALDDDGIAQRYIRTVHRKGFRFVGEMRHGSGTSRVETLTPEALVGSDGPSLHGARPSVIVLPFINLSSDLEQEYLSDGITADVIARLSKYRWIDVIARNTSFGYKGKAMDVRELGALLQVDYVVEGSVQRVGSRIRIGVQLIDAHTGHSKWSDRNDRELADIFVLQDEITEIMAARIEPEIGVAERNRVHLMHPPRANAPDLKAWESYHLGVFHFFRFTGPDNVEAQRLLRHSQELDPQFGEPFAWWAYATILGMVYWDTSPTQDLLDEALKACDRALEIDGQDATFHALRARVLLARQEYDQAITANEMAISLNPSLAAAHCGLGDSLTYETRYDEAVRSFDKAIALSPNDPQIWAFYSYGALSMIFSGQYEKALQWAEKAASIPNHQYWTLAHRAVALACLGRIDEAQAAADRLLHKLPRFCRNFAREKLFFLREPDQVELYLEALRLAGIPE